MGIKRLIIPLFRKNIRIFISIILLGSLSIAMMIGLSGSHKSLFERTTEYVDECQYPDIIYNTSLMSQNYLDIDEIRMIDGVEKAAYRLWMDFSVTHNDEMLTVRMFTYSKDTFMKYITIDKAECDSKYRIKVDTKFAKQNNIKVLDTINATIYGQSIPFVVEEIVKSAEDFSCKQNEYLLSSSTTFGFVYIDEKLLGNDYMKLFNQLLILGDGSVSNDELRNRINDRISLKTLSEKTKEESLVYKNILDNTEAIGALSNFVPIVFLAITMVVMMLFIYQVVLRYKRNLGILLTIGYDKKSLYTLFLLVGLIIALLSTLTGLLIGYGLDIYAYQEYLKHFEIDFSLPKIDVMKFVVSVLTLFIISSLSSVLSAFFVINRLSPVEVVRNQVETRSIGIKTNMLRAKTKVEANRIIRNYKENLIALFSLTSSFVIMFMGFAFKNANFVVKEDLFDKRIHFDTMVFLGEKNENKIRKDLLKMPSISDFDITYFSELTIEGKGGRKSVALLNGIDSDTHLISILGSNHDVICLPSDGIVLDIHTADDIGVKEGDEVIINGVKTFVSKISSLDMLRIQYLNKELFKSITEDYTVSVNIKGTSRQEIIKDISSLSYFQSSSDTDSMLKASNKVNQQFDVGIFIIIGAGLLIGITIVSNVREVEYKKDVKCIAIKKTLGYSNASIYFEMLVLDVLRWIISSTIGAFAARILSIKGLSIMESPTESFPYVDSVWVFLITTLLIVVSLLVTQLITMIRIKKMNISEYMKDKE